MCKTGCNILKWNMDVDMQGRELVQVMKKEGILKEDTQGRQRIRTNEELQIIVGDLDIVTDIKIELGGQVMCSVLSRWTIELWKKYSQGIQVRGNEVLYVEPRKKIQKTEKVSERCV